jgi:plastocyanin domain-containing protein
MIYLFNIIGILLILAVIIWFWLTGNKKLVVETNHPITIQVANGVYDPAQIIVKIGEPITLRFIRKDETPCAEMVIFADLNQSLQLPIDQAKSITITLPHPGEYLFTCQMGMYRGKLIGINKLQ